MLTGKRIPLYISLCFIVCLVGMALFTILVQPRTQSGAQWAERASFLYAASLDMGQERKGREQMLADSRAAMIRALHYDPYNAAHWTHLGVIEQHYFAAAGASPLPSHGSAAVIARLKPEMSSPRRDPMLPVTPPRQRRGLD